MAILLKNKRIVAAVLAGAVVIAAVIAAGTFGWFTSGSDLNGDTFTTAIVRLSDEGVGGFEVYEFAGNRGINIRVQTALEAMDPGDPSAAFAAYLRNLNWDNWLTKGDWDDLKMESDELQREAARLFAEWRAARRDFRDAANAYRDALRALGVAVDAVPEHNPPRETDPEFQRSVTVFGNTINYIDYFAYGLALAEYEAGYFIKITNWLDDVYNLGAAAGMSLQQREQLRELRNQASALYQEAQGEYDKAMAYLTSKGAYVLGEKDKVTPGSVIYGEFTVENDSNVDTYFRIKSTTGSVFSNPEGNVTAAVAGTGAGDFSSLTEGDDGYFYSPARIEGTVDEIKIILGVYVFGSVNIAQEEVFSVDNLEVEIIQASNNAALLHWNAEAGLPDTFWND